MIAFAVFIALVSIVTIFGIGVHAALKRAFADGYRAAINGSNDALREQLRTAWDEGYTAAVTGANSPRLPVQHNPYLDTPPKV